MADNTIINNLKVLNNPVNSAKIIKASDLNEAFRSTSLITANLLDILGGGSSNEYIPNSEYPMPPGNIIDNTTTSGIIKNIMSQWLDNYTYKHAHRKDSTPTNREIAHPIISTNLYDNKEDIAFGNLIPLYKINFDEYGHFKNTSNILDELENNDSIKTINEMYVGNLSLDGTDFNTRNYAANYIIAGPTLQKDRGAIRSRLLPLIQNVDSMINNINVNGIYRVKKGISGKSGILIISAHNYDKEIPKTKAIRIFISDDNIIYTNTGEYTVDSSNKITNITWSNTWINSYDLMLNTIVQDTNIQTNFNAIQENMDNFVEFSLDIFMPCLKSSSLADRDGAFNPLNNVFNIYDVHLNIKCTLADTTNDRPKFIDTIDDNTCKNTFANKKAIIDWLVTTVLTDAWSVINISGELYFYDSLLNMVSPTKGKYLPNSRFKLTSLIKTDNFLDYTSDPDRYIYQIEVEGIFSDDTKVERMRFPLWDMLRIPPFEYKENPNSAIFYKTENTRKVQLKVSKLEEII